MHGKKKKRKGRNHNAINNLLSIENPIGKHPQFVCIRLQIRVWSKGPIDPRQVLTYIIILFFTVGWKLPAIYPICFWIFIYLFVLWKKIIEYWIGCSVNGYRK